MEQVRRNLLLLRRGQGLSHPTSVLSALDEAVRAHLLGDRRELSPTDTIAQLVEALRRSIAALVDEERLYAEVDFNLTFEHRYATLTERHDSLARQLKCTAKTVRRRADRALDTLTYRLLTDDYARPDHAYMSTSVVTEVLASHAGGNLPWTDQLRSFWQLRNESRIDVVCSEIPECERPEYALPANRNYLRYAKFADLDTLIYLRTRFAQLAPDARVRDFTPSEYYDTQADILVVVGGPPWNAKYRDFLPQLPFYFEPHPLGEDDPLVIGQLDDLALGPRWTERQELLEDIAVFTRLSLAQGTTVFLLGGCLTLGVLGAAQCLLEGERGARSAQYVTERTGKDDFVLVVETRRVGGITDVSDLMVNEPLLLLTRKREGSFVVATDNTRRYSAVHTTGSRTRDRT